MATKRKPAKPKAAREKPNRWIIQVNSGLRLPFTEMAKSLGMTVGGAASAALDQWRKEQQAKLIKAQAEDCIAGDGKGEQNVAV